MAKVRMIETYSIPSIQETFDTAYDYTYCDRCGSFGVEMSSRLPRWLDKALMMVVFGSMGIFILGLATVSWQVMLAAVLAGLLSFIVVGASGFLKCKKCGNTQFTSRNVKRYAENDHSVIDVPGDAVMKQKVS